MKKYDTVVFIGRFQPLHIGHVQVINQALELAEQVIILIGSVNGPRTFKNPFTFEQRSEVIKETVNSDKLYIEGLRDFKYNDNSWIQQVQDIVDQYTVSKSVAIIGYHKDDSSNYLNWFPQWNFISVDLNKNASVIDATTVRNILFEDLNPGFFKGVLPESSYNFLLKFKESNEYKRIKEEYDIVKAYKKSWDSAPYPPTFICTDAVVVCSGHILMIKRGAQPGKGQWALPGGFLDQNEKIKDCAIRELIEETKIDVPKKVLEGSIEKSEIFDHPGRSLRGRTVTHAFKINVGLSHNGKLPKVKGGDDASDAKWISLNELANIENEIYEDHYQIIQHMLGN